MRNHKSSSSPRVDTLFRIWSRFYDHPIPQKLFYGRVHQILLAETCDLKPTQILDAGCGTGELLAKIARRWPNAHLTGIDLSQEMLEVAKQKNYGGTDVDFFEASVYELPCPSNTFDLITNTISSHFYLQFETALSEFYRVLKPGGTLAMASPGNGPLRFLPGPWKKTLSVPDAEYRSPQQQTKAMESEGFTVNSVVPLPFFSWLYIATKPTQN